MAKRNAKQPASDAKVPIYTRFSPETIAAIDALCEAHPLKPNRARLIEAAVTEYIDRHKGERRDKAGA